MPGRLTGMSNGNSADGAALEWFIESHRLLRGRKWNEVKIGSRG